VVAFVDTSSWSVTWKRSFSNRSVVAWKRVVIGRNRKTYLDMGFGLEAWYWNLIADLTSGVTGRNGNKRYMSLLSAQTAAWLFCNVSLVI
jgi:hypothetical protein